MRSLPRIPVRRVLVCVRPALPSAGFLSAWFVLALLSWGDVHADGSRASTPRSEPAPLVATDVAAGLEHPWGLAFLPDGRFLVTERPGRMRIVGPEGALSPPLSGMPATVVSANQGGLLDVVLDPAYTETRRIYFSFSEVGPRGQSTAVARAALDPERYALESVEVIFRQLPKVGGHGHFGSRLVFSADETHLFVTAGDRQQKGRLAQQLDNGIGKVFRIRPDGGAPPDNPLLDHGDGKIWSFGHRNVQGAALHPATGELWTHEHGPQGGDEVNIAKRGANFGWPIVSYGCPYGSIPCRPIGGGTHAPDYVEPLATWVPSTAPSGMAFYTAEAIPEWRGKLLVGALRGATLWVLDPEGAHTDGIVCLPARQRRHCREADVVRKLGERIRDVRQGPDGWVYLLTDSPKGRIVRLSR